MTVPWTPLTRVPPYPIERQTALAARVGRLLAASGSTVLVPGEAVVALEAVAGSVGVPGTRALNVITSPYGGLFGRWLQRGGAEVVDVTAEAGRPIEAGAVADALGSGRFDVVALVHGEAASGILNPLDEIAGLARGVGALVVVDAVASVGAHPLDVDRQDLDVVVIGPQKALGGPASLSAVAVSARAEPLLHRGPVQSSVALPEPGVAVPLGTADPLSFWALEAALDAVDDAGLPALIARHARAAGAARAAVRAVGAQLWVPDDARASHLVTAAAVPDGVDAGELLRAIGRLDPAGASAGVGPAGDRFVRLNHTGLRADLAPLLTTVLAYGHALQSTGARVDLGAAADALLGAYDRA